MSNTMKRRVDTPTTGLLVRLTRGFLGGSALACALCFAGLAAAAVEPWNGPAFSADPAAVYQAAASQPVADGVDVVVLFEEGRYVFDAQGRSVYTWRMVYRLVTPAGVEGWSDVGAQWEPWHEEAPSIRARVITADHVAHELDPKTIGEAPAQNHDRDVFIDRRVLRAPLPAVALGAVVEQEIVLRETAPAFDQGVVHHFYFGKSVPVRHTRLTIDAPSSLPLRYVTRLLPSVVPQRSESEGKIRLVFEAGPTEPVENAEPYMPGDVARWPHVAFTTGRTWKEVASRYGEMVEEQIRGADVQTLLDGIVPGNKTRQEIAAALVARLHHEVRYTGVEFGQASLVPRAPVETLKRKYGDCKDKAALLIAMLRAAGIPAQMALLSTAPGEDVESDLPGLGAFDHAIVYVPGSPDLWIDSTAEFARVGELPSDDQGRLALIAGSGTSGLIRTPEAASTDNRTLETREIFLSELGPGQVIETTETWGSFEQGYRAAYSAPDSKDTRKRLEDYVKDTYAAGELTKFEHTNSNDFSTPFRLRLEAKQARRAMSAESEAAVAILGLPVAGRLPSLFSEGGEDSDNTGDTAASPESDSKSRRQADLVLPVPYVSEWRYRIVPPPGFKPRQLPEAGKEELGPAVLSKEFAAAPDGVVTATVRFDTVKRRLTPDETSALRAGVRKLQQSEPIMVTFEQTGEAYLASGKIREALDEFKALAALHPQEALHHSQIAKALLAAGIGEAARQEAQRAIQLEPSSSAAYQTLGWVLEHDLVGRRFAKGFDLAGAESAYRKAAELDPSDAVAGVNLAILLEHDAQGFRYSPKAKLREAITVYQSLGDKLAETDASDNLLFALMWARRFKELKVEGQKPPTSPTRESLVLVAIAATDGPAAAIREVFQDIPANETRRTVLQNAGNHLMHLRLYPQAAELLAAGAQGTEDAAAIMAKAELLRNAQRNEEAVYPDNDPRSVVKMLFALIFSSDPGADGFAKLASRHSADPHKSKGFADLQQSMGALRSQLKSAEVPIEVIADLTLSGMRMTVEGDDAWGYRVHVQGATPSGANSDIFYVVREEGQYRILDSGPNLTSVGNEILALVEKGDLAGARHWLDWAREDQPLAGGDDPFAGPAFPRFWERGAQGDRDAIRYAAASLLARGDGAEAEKAIPILREGREKATSEAAQINFDFALAQAFIKLKRIGDLLPAVRHLAQSSPNSPTAFFYLTGSQIELKQWAECERAAEERLKRLPNDTDAITALRRAAVARGDIEKAVQLERRIVSMGKAEANDFNELAWDILILGTVTPEAVEAAQRANQLTNNNSGGYLHTLASIYAEAGKTSEAREVLLHAMDVWGLEEPNPACWYVFGRIAEQFGVRDAALADYQKVTRPERELWLANSTYVLAQRRLVALRGEKLTAKTR